MFGSDSSGSVNTKGPSKFGDELSRYHRQIPVVRLSSSSATVKDL